MRQERCGLLAGLGFLLFVMCFAISPSSSAEGTPQITTPGKLSHARVVRLSFVEGTVSVQRPGSSAWGAALLNSPIQEGFSVETAKKSFAEIQFEDGSTVRVGELSEIRFTQLALTQEGGHINHVTLENGYATLDVTPQRHDEYVVAVSGVFLTPHGKSEFRTDLNQDRLRVEVFGGRVQASDSSETQMLKKNHVLSRDFDGEGSFQIADKIQKDEWDKWTDAREQQSVLAFNDTAVDPTGPLYGWDDLDVYGDWSYFPGYGIGWAPYEAIGWSPYQAGMWDSYPGMGYTWISGEPWGWLPFHYGFWNFNPGMGWFWMPGAASAAWSPALVNWYSGPGWIGWAPVGASGVGGRAPCTLAVTGCLTAVAPGVLTSREPIRPGSPILLHPASNVAIRAIDSPDIAPAHSNIVSRQLTERGAILSNRSEVGSRGVRVPNTGLLRTGFTRGAEGAPSTIIMGRQVTTETFMGHRSAIGNFFGGRQPIRVQIGSTMGGRFPIRNGAGPETGLMRGGPFHAPGPRSGVGGPQILSRASVGGFPSGAGAGPRSGVTGGSNARTGSVGSSSVGASHSAGSTGSAGGGSGHR